MRIFIILLLCSLFFAKGVNAGLFCDGNTKERLTQSEQSIKDLHNKYINLEKDIEALKKEYKYIDEFLKTDRKNIECLFKVITPAVVLEPVVDKYQMLYGEGGVFAILCKNIEKYANGTELFFYITNFYSTFVKNVEFSLFFVTSDKQYINPVVETIQEIGPGMSKEIKIRVPNCRPDNISSILITAKVAGMRPVGIQQ